MLGFRTRWQGLSLLGVILLRHSSPCWAADTTARSVSATLYAGAGKLEEPNNEGAPAEYDEHREGLGATAHLRLEKGDLGPFLMLAGTFELESLRQTECGWYCSPEDQAKLGSFHTYTQFAGRAGVGYSFKYVELRGGVLFTHPDADAPLADQLILPEVLVRLGRREVGWFELGLGAYDASTALRPGAFLGGAGTIREGLRLGGHLGMHFPNGYSSSISVPQYGLRGEASLDWELTPTLVVGGSAALTSDFAGHLVGEGSAKLSLLF